MSSIPPIGIGTFLPIQQAANPTGEVAAAKGGENANFGNAITRALESVEGLQERTADLAVKAATGDLTDVSDYMIASAQSGLALDVTLAVRNKALESYQEIMRMQI
jgi:flagellar hook-basal body complex protein FliE